MGSTGSLNHWSLHRDSQGTILTADPDGTEGNTGTADVVGTPGAVSPGNWGPAPCPGLTSWLLTPPAASAAAGGCDVTLAAATSATGGGNPAVAPLPFPPGDTLPGLVRQRQAQPCPHSAALPPASPAAPAQQAPAGGSLALTPPHSHSYPPIAILTFVPPAVPTLSLSFTPPLSLPHTPALTLTLPRSLLSRLPP